MQVLANSEEAHAIMRLEALRLAQVASHDPGSVLALAKEFYAFLKGDSADEDSPQ